MLEDLVAVQATPDDYYDHIPDPPHSTGDIWCGLPSYGALKQELVAGIVITPACDLQNSKSETITYLPILSFESWFATFSMLRDVRGMTQHLWRTFAEQHGAQLDASLPELPSLADVELIRRSATELPEAKSGLRGRILAGLSVISAILTSDTLRCESQQLGTLFGAREFHERCCKLVMNSLRADTHFLPARGRWALADDSFNDHSLALFRYPLTAPLDLLDLALKPTTDWTDSVAQFSSMPAAKFFAARQPTRIARLKPRFFADLLSRYTALYARVGAPDFAPQLVTTLASQIATPKE